MTTTLKDHLALFARYHGWATERLLASVGELPDEIYRRDAGLFFRSVHGTLNHLLLTDAQLWYPRFAEGRSPALALDAEIEGDRPRLAERLADAARKWPPFVTGLSEEQLAGSLTYRTTQGAERSLPLAAALLHVFNHATHHRAQATAGLSAAGHPYAPLDLLMLIAAEASPGANRL